MKRVRWFVAPAMLFAAAGCGGGGGSASVDDWCDFARDVEANESLDSIDVFDPTEAEKGFNLMLDTANEAVKQAPSAIKPDIEEFQKAVQAMYDEMDRVDFNIMDADQGAIEDISNQVDDANASIEDFNFDECGIEKSTDTTVAGETMTDETMTDETVADSGSADTTVADSGAGSDPGSNGTLRDMMVQEFMGLGLTEDEAGCIADNLDFSSMDTETGPDMGSMLEVFDTCGIDMTRLAELGG
ncbi:MAG: hypothetical protein R2705_10025 [Ilumatobacteraceae bacterium]